MEIKHKVPVWSNPEAVVLWAWRQSISSNNDLRNNSMPSTCIVCGERSIEVVGIKVINKATGICCKNPKCQMFNVLIPAKMIESDIDNIPADKLMKILSG